MKKDVPKFLVAKNHIGGTKLDFQMELSSTKGKVMALLHQFEETWRLFCWQPVPLLPQWRQCHILQESWPGSCKVCCCHRSPSYCWCFTPRSFLNQIWAAILGLGLVVVPALRADHQPLTDVAHVNPPTIALDNTDSSLCSAGIAILCHNEGAHSAGLRWRMWAWESFEHAWCHPMNSCWRSCLMSPCIEILLPRDWKGRAGWCWKDCDKEKFQGGWTAPAPELTATQPEVTARSGVVQGSSVPIQCLPAEDWST